MKITTSVNENPVSRSFNKLEFEAYLRRAREEISKAHSGQPKPILSEIIQTAAPRQTNKRPKNRHGVILIHGLLDTPNSMLSIENSLIKAGYFVKTLLLSGHGTSPNALLEVHYQQWIYEVILALESFGSEVDKISLIGLSTGALLALKAALLYPEKVCSLVIFSPAFKLRPLPQLLLPYLYKLKNFFPWLIKKEEVDYAKYSSIATNGAYQVHALGKKIRKELNNSAINMPVYMVLTEDDETISVKAALQIYQKLNADTKQLRYYANQQSEVSEDRIIVQSCYPAEKILNFSHVCLTNSPEHPHFGQKNKPYNYYQGALTAKNLSSYHPLTRNTYNPDFENLINSIYKFLQ